MNTKQTVKLTLPIDFVASLIIAGTTLPFNLCNLYIPPSETAKRFSDSSTTMHGKID